MIQVKDFSRRDKKMLNVNVRWTGGGGKRRKKNEKYEMSREIKEIKRCRRMVG